MNFKSISNIELTHQLTKLVRTERKITYHILQHINEFESRKLYAIEGYDGMFSYLTKFLGYGESSAYSRLQAARLLKQIPEIALKIQTGALNLTQLIHVEKCLKAEKQKGISRSTEETHQVLEKIEQCNVFETKKILAVEFIQPLLQHTRVQPQKDDSVRLEITFTQDQFESLKKAQSLLSHICLSGDLSEVIATLALKFNQSKLGKAESASESESASKAESPSTLSQKLLTQSFASTALKSKRKYISIKMRRSVQNEFNHSCGYISLSGYRCDSKFQLQIDHRKPLALGGTNDMQNLRILCRTHNIWEAQRLGL